MNLKVLRHRHVSEHQKPDYPDHPAPGGGNYEGGRIREHHKHPSREELPIHPARGGASTRRPGIRERLRERFREKPATREEIMQLELDTRREQLKSQKHQYKTQRPNALERIVGGGQRQPRPSGRSYAAPRRTSGQMGRSLLDSNTSFGMGSFGSNLGKTPSSWGTGLNSMLGSHTNEMMKPKRTKQMPYQKSGLEKMFSF